MGRNNKNISLHAAGNQIVPAGRNNKSPTRSTPSKNFASACTNNPMVIPQPSL